MTLTLALAALTLAAWLSLAIAALLSHYKVPRLHDVAPARPGDSPLPRLSIIATAHNEERSMERALRSLLTLRYPGYEVIFVNDRSTDRTGEIAERLSAGDPRLNVLHIDELPAGWFGKTHAARRGADAATGEVLLFTDADLVFAPAGPCAACGTCSGNDSTTLPRRPASRSPAPCSGPARSPRSFSSARGRGSGGWATRAVPPFSESAPTR